MRISPRRRIARKHHRCDGQYHHETGREIRPREPYWVYVLAPHEDVNSSDSFWRLKLCVRCHVRQADYGHHVYEPTASPP